MFSRKLISLSHVVLEKVHRQKTRSTIWRAHSLGTPAILEKREKESQDKEEMTRRKVRPNIPTRFSQKRGYFAAQLSRFFITKRVDAGLADS